VSFRDALGPRRPFACSARRTSLSRDSKPLPARPPSPLIVRFAMFTRSADKRFSGSGCRPTTSATALSTHGHTPEHPILAQWFERPACAVDLESAHAFRRAFGGPATFPCRRRIASATSRNSPIETGRTAMQARRKARPRQLPPDHDAACGRRLGPTTVCGGGRRLTTLDWTGRVAWSEGPSRPPSAAAERRG